jgi:hypothetical protein
MAPATLLGNVAYVVYVWPFGIKYQREFHTSFVFSMNARVRRSRLRAHVDSHAENGAERRALQCPFVFWIEWAAFPWLGETF